ncbi:MAG: PAS domain-containing protein, partial [Bauldia sp.]|nr:PAS domain-containing protein [Bauldia sp.]
MIDRSGRITGAGRLIVVAFALVGAAVGFALVERDRSEPFILGLLGILAVIGVFTLLAAAIGLVRFRGRGQSAELTMDFLDSMGEGVLISDRAGRIVYANRAYADLIGAADEKEVRGVERVFAAEASATEAIYRLTRAVRDGQAVSEEIRVSAPLSAGAPVDARARWYRIKATPLSPRGLAAWTVADISHERAQQESVFQELQHAIDYLDHAPAGFFSAEPDGRIVYLNATLAEWLGIDIARFEAGKL